MGAASLLAVVLVIAILTFDAGAGSRQRSEDAKVMEPVTDLSTLAGQYAAFAAPVNQNLGTDINSYNASEFSSPAAARSALRAEVTTERSFDASLTTWLAAWTKDYAAAKTLQANAESNPDESVTVTIPYLPAVAAAAQALLTADQASESLITRQAQAGTLPGMRSFNGAHQSASTAVEAQATLLRKDLHLPPA